MTKEELKQEAEELIQRYEMANSMNCFMQLTPDRKQIGELLVMIAEPREKRIAELEKELEQAKKVQVVEHFEAYGQCRDSRRIVSLEKENEELKDKLNNLASVAEVRLANWQKYEEENKELKETIHKAEEIIRGLYYIIQGRIDYENNVGIADEMWRAKQFLKR